MADTAAVVAELAHAYEQALIDGDGVAAAAFFADGADVTRFGPEGAQYGAEQVRTLRTGYAPVPRPTWLSDVVVVLAPEVAVHKAVLLRDEIVLQRTQIWVLAGTWKIVHAHVSRVAAP